MVTGQHGPPSAHRRPGQTIAICSHQDGPFWPTGANSFAGSLINGCVCVCSIDSVGRWPSRLRYGPYTYTANSLDEHEQQKNKIEHHLWIVASPPCVGRSMVYAFVSDKQIINGEKSAWKLVYDEIVNYPLHSAITTVTHIDVCQTAKSAWHSWNRCSVPFIRQPLFFHQSTIPHAQHEITKKKKK